MTLEAWPYILLLGFFFGSTLLASRFSVGQFSPSTYIWLRMMLASLAHLAVYLVAYKRRNWPTDRTLWRHSIILGVLGTALPMTSIVASLQYQSAGVASILLTTGPAVTVLMAHFFLLDEPLTRRKSLGVALALGGALLLTSRGESGLADVSRTNPLGYGLIFIAITVGSAMTIYARKFMRHFDSFDVASIRMFTAMFTVTPLSLWLVGFDLQRVTAQGYLALFYAALVGTFGGMFLAFYNVKRFGATASALVLYIIPVITGLGGVLLLDEQITIGMLAGLALIALGLLFINWSTGHQKIEAYRESK